MYHIPKWLGAAVLAIVCMIAAHADITKESRVDYTNWGKDDQQLSMWFPDDDGTELRPAMVLIHGGGWMMGSRMQIRTYGEEFAKAGYVTASISYRMMPDYAFPYCLYDVKQAIRYLREHASEYRIDPERIVVLGESAGGHLAGLAATTGPDDGFEGPGNPEVSTKVQAAVIFYGAVDLTQWNEVDRKDANRVQRGLLNFMDKFLSTEFPDVADPYANASPITYVDSNDPPTLFIHGTGDSLVKIDQSKNMYNKLKATGATTDFIEVEGAGHGFDHFSPTTRRKIIGLILEWLDEHLEPATAL